MNMKARDLHEPHAELGYYLAFTNSFEESHWIPDADCAHPLLYNFNRMSTIFAASREILPPGRNGFWVTSHSIYLPKLYKIQGQDHSGKQPSPALIGYGAQLQKCQTIHLVMK
jgi:hypothetical protein